MRNEFHRKQIGLIIFIWTIQALTSSERLCACLCGASNIYTDRLCVTYSPEAINDLRIIMITYELTDVLYF